MPILSLLLISLTWFMLPDTSVNGVKIVTRQVTGGFSDTRTEYLTASRLRNEWQTHYGERAGTPMASIIQRGSNGRVFVLDLQAHEYISYETDSQGGALGDKPNPVVYSNGVLQIWINSVDTGERQQMFGHLARHIVTYEKRVATPGACTHSSESVTDGWYIDDAGMPEWRRAKKSVAVAVLVSATTNACADKTDRIEVHRTGVELGFPLKTSTTTRSQVLGMDGAPRIVASNWGSEVTEFFEGPLDPALFEVPGDFRRVDVLKNWYSPAPRHQLTGWEWFKEKVEEFFR